MSKGEKHEHWLYYASDKYPKKFVEEVRRVLSVAFIYIPLPVFWTLYDQQVREAQLFKINPKNIYSLLLYV